MTDISTTFGRSSRRNRRLEFQTALLNFFSFTKTLLVQHFQTIIIGLGTTVLILETIEHLDNSPDLPLSFYFISEILLVILFLSLAAFTFRLFLVTLNEKTGALTIIDQKRKINQILTFTSDSGEVAQQMAEIVSANIPNANVVFYIQNRGRNQLEMAACRVRDDEVLCGAPSFMDISRCAICSANNPGRLRPQCMQPVGGKTRSWINQQNYCIPLVYGKHPVGLLQLNFHNRQDVSVEQLKVVENISEEMSSALWASAEKASHMEMALEHSVNNVQLDIARDIHDTIGQNISYLRMKLEQLEDTQAASSADIHTEIRKMSSVANESYDLVRGTLSILQAGSKASLCSLLESHARTVIDRTSLLIDVQCVGDPQILEARMMRQIFYIFREALHNIEKHANARNIDVAIYWSERTVTLEIKDDGCGFDLAKIPNNHYGIRFMRERTQNLKGEFTIQSEIGLGTCITIQMPIG